MNRKALLTHLCFLKTIVAQTGSELRLQPCNAYRNSFNNIASLLHSIRGISGIPNNPCMSHVVDCKL